MEFVGNTAIEGAAMALLNQQARDRLTGLQQEMSVQELSIQADFQDIFIRSLTFPARTQERN